MSLILKNKLFPICTLRPPFWMILLRFLAMLLPCKTRRHWRNWFHEFYFFSDFKNSWNQNLIFFSGCFKAALIPSKTLDVISNNLSKFLSRKMVARVKWKIYQPVFTIRPNPNTIPTTAMEMEITRTLLRKNENKKKTAEIWEFIINM